MLRKRFLAALPAFFGLSLVEKPSHEMLSGAPEEGWDWVGTCDDGFGKIKLREDGLERSIVLEPSVVHESLKPAEPQGLYIRAPKDSPIWSELAGIFSRGRSPDA
jgi:hypothetical protein